MKKILERSVTLLILLWLLVYGGDGAVYRLRGAPKSKVMVNQFVSVPLKGNLEEYDYQGSVETPCSLSVFGHGGLDACWKLRRTANRGLKN